MFEEFSSLVLRPPPKWERAPNQGEISRSLAKIEGSVKNIAELVAQIQLEKQIENSFDYTLRTSSLRIMKPYAGQCKEVQDFRDRHVSFSFPVRVDSWSSSNCEKVASSNTLKPKPHFKPILNNGTLKSSEKNNAKKAKTLNAKKTREYDIPDNIRDQPIPKSDTIQVYKKFPNFDLTTISALPPPSPKSGRSKASATNNNPVVRTSPDLNRPSRNDLYKSLSLQPAAAPKNKQTVGISEPGNSRFSDDFGGDDLATMKRGADKVSPRGDPLRRINENLILDGAYEPRNHPPTRRYHGNAEDGADLRVFPEFYEQYTEAMKILDAYETKKANRGGDLLKRDSSNDRGVGDPVNLDWSNGKDDDDDRESAGKLDFDCSFDGGASAEGEEKNYDTLKKFQKAQKAQKEFVVGGVDVYDERRMQITTDQIKNNRKDDAGAQKGRSTIWGRIKRSFSVFWVPSKKKEKALTEEEEYYKKYWAQLSENKN